MKIWHRVALGLLSALLACGSYSLMHEETPEDVNIFERWSVDMQRQNNIGVALGASLCCAWYAVKPARKK